MMSERNKILCNWSPSQATIKLLYKNGVSDEMIHKSVHYLKSQNILKHIDDVEGYTNWNSFFLVFCVKANRNNK